MEQSLSSLQTNNATANILLHEEKLKESPATNPDNISVGIKKPRRLIHFSDGVLEEYSTDEEDGAKETSSELVVNPKTLTWLPYLWYYTVVAATKTVGACDFMGEKLAYFLGITSPKYQYAINEYNRLEEEERNDLDKEQKERELHRERIAMKEADRVYAETIMPYSSANPGVGTDI